MARASPRPGASWLVLFLLLATSYAVMDMGTRRFNRLHDSLLMAKLTSHSVVAVSSNHFLTTKTPRANILSSHPPLSYNDNLTWAELSSLPTTSSSKNTLSSALSTSSPFMKAFNSRLSRDTWGSWAVPHSLSPTDAMQSSEPEQLAWEHPETTSLSLVLDGQEYEAVLTRNSKFIATSFTSQQQVWVNGTRHPDQEPSPRTRSSIVDCYYDGRLRPVHSLPPNRLASTSNDAATTTTVTASAVSGVRTLSLAEDAGTATKEGAGVGIASISVATGKRSTSALLSDSPVTINTCSGGFDGLIRTPQHTYVITPALNHFSAQKLAKAMSALEKQSLFLPLGSLHVVYRLDRDFNTTGLSGCGVGDGHESVTDILAHDSLASTHTHTHSHPHVHTHAHVHEDEHAHLPSSSSSVLPSALHAQHLLANDTLLNSKKSNMSLQANDQLYLEWLLVSDNRRVLAFGNDVEPDMLKIAHFVASYYTYHSTTATGVYKFVKPISIVLVAHVAFTISDPYEASVQPGDPECTSCSPTEVSSATLLSVFSNWRASNAAPPHDNGHLLSGHDFDAGVLGLAYLGTQCSRSAAGGIDQTTRSYSTAFNSIVTAHELGHNFRLFHDSDNNSCAAGANIMSAMLNPFVDLDANPMWTRMSECSVSYFNTYISTNALTCLYNEPSTTYEDGMCGDGIVQAGEECDCGASDCAITDPCCDGSKCLLKASVTFNGASYQPKCSSRQACCTEQCLFRPTTHVCRASLGQCDYDEYCDGASATCPRDVVTGNGHPCVNSDAIKGVCYLGSCTSFDASCKELGKKYMNVDTYRGCPQQTALNQGNFCGYQYCLPSPTATKCETFFIGGVAAPMQDGVYCGVGKQCFSRNCVEMSSLAKDFTWQTTAWSACDRCGSLQLRKATCTDTSSSTAVNEKSMCVPEEAMPFLTQRCDNITLGCVYDFSSEEMSSSDIYLFGATVPMVIVAYVSVGVILFYFLLVAVCYRSVTQPVHGVKNMQDREHDNKVSNLDDDDD